MNMGKNENDLLRMVRMDNDTAIKKMAQPSDDPLCDARHGPLSEGIARSIRVQEIVLEHVMVSSNGKPATNGDAEKTFAGMSYGKWKAGFVPAVIISVFIGIAILQYSYTLKVAAVVKEEAKTEAAVVAKEEVKRENRAIDRNEVATLVRDEIAEAVATYIQEQKKR